MQHKNEEPMIYLKDLLFVVLYRWKVVIAVALILAFALGGTKLISGLATLKSEDALQTHNKNQAILLENYEAEKASLEQRIDALRSQIKSQDEYLENSIYMQLDPYGFYESTLSLYFNTDYQILPGMEYQNLDSTDSVISSYYSILSSEQVLSPIADVVETTPQYMKELITLYSDPSTDMLTITLRYPDATGIEKLVDHLLMQLDTVHEQVSQTVTEHQVSTVSKTINKRVDRSVADTQNSENTRMTTLVADLTDIQAQKDALVRPQPQQIDKSSIVKSGIIYAVVGCVLGAFIVAFICWVAHIGTDTVYSSRTMKNRTGIKVLGCISDRKRNPIDRWLRKLEGRNTVEPQLQAHMLAVDISHRCGEAGKLLVTGSADAQARQQVLQALSEVMPGMQLTDAGNILQDVTALEALSGCDAVLLVEKCGQSKYSAVTQQIEWINDYDKQLIGCVLLGG